MSVDILSDDGTATPSDYVLSLVGTQLTNWNFLAWTTSTSGNVENFVCLESDADK